MTEPKFSLKKIMRILVLTLYVTFVICLLILFTKSSPEAFLNYIKAKPHMGLLILAIAYCVKAIAFVIPVLLLFIIAGILLPAPLAAIFTYILIAIEFTLTFKVGRKLGSEKIRNHLSKSKSMRRLLAMNPDRGFPVTVLLRFVPFLSLDLISLLLSTTTMSYRTFLLGSLVGITPNLLAFIFIGESISNPGSIEFLIPVIAKLIFTISMFIYYKKSSKFNR